VKRIIFLSIVGVLSLFGDEGGYQLGHGYRVGSLPLYVGGYVSLELDYDVGRKSKVELEELALMVYGEEGRFSYLFEIEGEDLYTKIYGDDTPIIHKQLYLERFYLAYAVSEQSSLRIGKFHSPIGFWNKNPINVLRDTSSNPSITQKLFPKLTSGVELEYKPLGSYPLQMNFFAQNTRDLDSLYVGDIYNNFDAKRHYGVGVGVEYGGVKYQLGGGTFELTNGDGYTYGLVGLSYEVQKERFQAELGTQYRGDSLLGTQYRGDSHTLPYIGYLQWVHSFDSQHQSIVRLEGYEEMGEEETAIVVGYTYRPSYPIALKWEYQWHAAKNEGEIILSASILF